MSCCTKNLPLFLRIVSDQTLIFFFQFFQFFIFVIISSVTSFNAGSQNSIKSKSLSFLTVSLISKLYCSSWSEFCQFCQCKFVTDFLSFHLSLSVLISHQATCRLSAWLCRFRKTAKVPPSLWRPSSRSWWCVGNWRTISAFTTRNTTEWRVGREFESFFDLGVV